MAAPDGSRRARKHATCSACFLRRVSAAQRLRDVHTSVYRRRCPPGFVSVIVSAASSRSSSSTLPGGGAEPAPTSRRTPRAHGVVPRRRSLSFAVGGFHAVVRRRPTVRDPSQHRAFTRNEGVRGSNPRVGSFDFRGASYANSVRKSPGSATEGSTRVYAGRRGHSGSLH